VSGLEAARDTRAALGRRIAVLRRAAGLTQRELGMLAGYSRSAVALAEASGACSRPFCVRAGRALGVGGELAAAHDRAAALTIAARAEVARARRRPRLAPGPDGQEAEDPQVLARQAACPHCGKPVVVLIRQGLSLLPLNAA
jgi:hypothetical protein